MNSSKVLLHRLCPVWRPVWRTLRCFAGALALALGGVGSAAAGAWEAQTAQGFQLRITQNTARPQEPYGLERRYPDGSLDPAFGQGGRARFMMGPDHEVPAVLRVDAQGRPWIAGASAAQGNREQAVVLRFQVNGAPDTSYADGGRSATAPAGRQARAQDVLPLPDGSAWVAGQVQDAQGVEHTGWWRLTRDGRVDPAFGLGGLWVDETAGAAEVLELAVGGDGSVAMSLRRGEGAAARVEVWASAAGGQTPVRLLVAPDEYDPRLSMVQGRWGLAKGQPGAPSNPTAPVAAATASAPLIAPGPATRPTQAPNAPVVTEPPAGQGDTASWGPLGLLGLGVFVAVGAGLFAWVRRRDGRSVQR